MANLHIQRLVERLDISDVYIYMRIVGLTKLRKKLWLARRTLRPFLDCAIELLSFL